MSLELVHELDTVSKIESAPAMCPALEGTIIKLGALEQAIARLDSSLAMTNQTLQRLTTTLETLNNALGKS